MGTILQWLLSILLILTTSSYINCWMPCTELSPAIRMPCRCQFDTDSSIGIECDRVVLTSEIPSIPLNAPISTFQQRHSGLLTIPMNILAASKLPVTKLDFSHNYIRGFVDKTFGSVKETLKELRLNNNNLGDSLNPIFSTTEFQSLGNLEVLDVSQNKIKSIEEGILKGCLKLEEIYLDSNNLQDLPTNSLNGPVALRILSIVDNQISNVKSHAFASQPKLEKIDLRNNRINYVDSDAFVELTRIKEIYLGRNQLSRFNSDVFEDINSLQKLDLSENYFTSFPSVPLKEIENLKVLNLSSNMIKSIESSHLHGLKSLQILDMSRNAIVTIEPATFREQKNLRFLDLSLNSLRTIEDDAFEELDSLQTLIIRDNNILLVPGSALGRLPKLTNLYLDFNRVAALSSEILGSINSGDIRYMSLSRNVIRELPGGSFKLFKNLIYLDLLGNSLTEINAEMFEGLEKSLMELKLGQNKITTIGNVPLNLNQLRRLDLSHNNIVDVPKNVFDGVRNLVYLNFSHNHHLAPIPATLILPLTKLQILDLSNIGLRNINSDFFTMSPNLRTIVMRNNKITDILEASFKNLRNLTFVDLSFNNIMTIKPGAFINTMNMKTLLLRGNNINAIKGEMFNTGTGIEEIDLSENQISYIFQTSFKIHPRLRKLNLSNNRFNFFPASTISGLQFLEFIDLSFNQLKTVEELDFARLPRLRELILKENRLEVLSEMAFHNSSQLQIVDLSFNKLDRLGERTFEGFTRIEKLNLNQNLLTELPEGLFERTRIHALEKVILSNNRFVNAPLKSLQKRNVIVNDLDLSGNQIQEISTDDQILINVKKLDLSYNKLSIHTIDKIFNEPKTVRTLNLAGTGVSHIPLLETPFLQNLNLSENNIESIHEKTFERTPLLEVLDLSSNKLGDLSSLSGLWAPISSLKHLDLSNNTFDIIAQGDFDNLEMLRTLSFHTQPKCTRIEKNAFRNLSSLSSLKAYDFPVLGYLDVQGILSELPSLEIFDIEVKDSSIGSDHIQLANHPRLKELGIRGYRLRSLSSGAFAGLKNKNLLIKLKNTSLTSLQPALFFPVPRSAVVSLDISGSMITVLSAQLLSALEDRRNSLTLTGLSSNPIHCDCNARALRRWLPNSHMTDIKCYTPDDLHGRLLTEVGDDELTCNPKKLSQVTASAAPLIEENFDSTVSYSTFSRLPPSSVILTRATTEPDIIWSAPTNQPTRIKTKLPLVKHPLTNDDTLILGIVGAVVAFILILIIVICIVRLRMNSNSMSEMAPGINTDASVQLSYKTMPAIYFPPQHYASNTQSYATLPHKISMSSQASLAQNYQNTLNHPHHQHPYHQHYMYQEEKNYR